MLPGVTIGSAEQRFVIVHYHIFKNGGSTIEAVLKREFTAGFATLHGPTEGCTLDGRDLERFLRQYPKVTAVSSHHLRYPKPAIRRVVIFDCCFVRHPLERLDSLYRYSSGSIGDDFLGALARRSNAREFFRELLNKAPHLISNVQVMQMACAGAFTRPAHPSDLERAWEIFADMAIPGVVERFEESLAAAEYFLKPAFPRLSLEFVPQNVTRAVSLHAPERLAQIWGAALYEDLARLNQLDLELFRRAEAEVRRRVSLIPEGPRRLLDFHSRCALLRGDPPPTPARTPQENAQRS